MVEICKPVGEVNTLNLDLQNFEIVTALYFNCFGMSFGYDSPNR